MDSRLGKLQAAEILDRGDLDFRVRVSLRDGGDYDARAGEAAAIGNIGVAEVVVAAAAYSGQSFGGLFFGIGDIFDGQ